MDRKTLVAELKKYFDIRELVCPDVFNEFGEKAWQFFDFQFLETVLCLRTQVHKKEMFVNNWLYKGTFTQRGLRCNICTLVYDKTITKKIYMTAHANGAALDYDVKCQTAEQSRQQVKECAYLLPNKVRLEKNVNWVHLDIYDDGSINKVQEFKKYRS